MNKHTQNKAPLTDRMNKVNNSSINTQIKRQLNQALINAKAHPLNRGICPKCGRLSKFCRGC